MKKPFFITILSCLFYEIAFAQAYDNSKLSTLTLEEAFRLKKVDTFYYPFYNGVQMIEIDHVGYWDKKIFFLEQSQPRALPHYLGNPMPIGNEFLFRDTTGAIVKAFNSRGSLAELTKYFKKVPINKRHLWSMLFPYHSSQTYRSKGIWYQSPQPSFNFSGNYKVSTGFAWQTISLFGLASHEDTKDIKFGLIDSFGNVRIPLEYDEILPIYGNLLVQKGKKWGIISYEQKVLVPLVYDNYKVDLYAREVYPGKGGSVFFLTLKKKDDYRTEYSYDALFLTAEDKLISLDHYDEVYLESSWTGNEDSGKRLLFITKNGKKGMLNSQYQEIVPPLYELFEYHNIQRGLIRMARDGKFGYWDKNFRIIIPLEYDYAEYSAKDSIGLLLKDGKFSCFNMRGKIDPNCKFQPSWKIAPLKFVSSQKYLSVQTEHIYGIIDVSSNKMIVPFKYRSIAPVEVRSFVERNRTIFKEKGLTYDTLPEVCDELLFRNNKILVRNKDNFYGVIDTTFQVVIDFKYEKLEVIQYNLAYLIYSLNGKPGVMDFAGKDIFSREYDEIRYSTYYEQEKDILYVVKNGKWGIIDFSGGILVPCKYDSIRFLGHYYREKAKLWIVEKNKKFGVVDDKNEIFVPFEYDGISHLAGTTLWVEDKNRKRYPVELNR